MMPTVNVQEKKYAEFLQYHCISVNMSKKKQTISQSSNSILRWSDSYNVGDYLLVTFTF